eukprot:Skav235068  [mRNA]  locus=scaffold3466:29295:35058:- [translate_table: standard]
MGAFLPASASEHGSGTWSPVTFDGLLEFGLAQSVTWGRFRLLKYTSSHTVLACPWKEGQDQTQCTALELPARRRPGDRRRPPCGGALAVHALLRHGLEAQWRLAATAQLSGATAAVSLTGDEQKILVPGRNGGRWPPVSRAGDAGGRLRPAVVPRQRPADTRSAGGDAATDGFAFGEVEELLQVFRRFDRDKDGRILKPELVALIEVLFPVEARCREFRPFLVQILQSDEDPTGPGHAHGNPGDDGWSILNSHWH